MYGKSYGRVTDDIIAINLIMLRNLKKGGKIFVILN